MSDELKDNTYDYIIELLNFHKSIKKSFHLHYKKLSKQTISSTHEQLYTIKKTIRSEIEGL